MSLQPGIRLGVYEIVSLLGAGGMGEVYRARDTRLKRDVAIKVLPDAFANDPERLARFQREAELLATLNHPNIAQIYGLEAGALVLELVDGPTLADRIAQGPISIDEALPIAKQIAEALEAAHEQGVIHRDLKPANIKLTPDGKVKVLDFGLAKAMEQAPGSGLQVSGLSQSPTITSPAMTMGGVILGTAAYMSPEQARGKAVDKRSDIWAFGCVLYEILTRRRAFEGEEVSDTLAAILRAEPLWSALPQQLPSSLVRLLARCLEKDVHRRLRDIGEARIELDHVHAGTSSDSTKSEPKRVSTTLRRNLLVAGSSAALAIVAVTAFDFSRSSTTPHRSMAQFAVSPANGSDLWFANPMDRPFTISRSGEEVTFVSSELGARGTRRDHLVIRPLNRLELIDVPATDGAQSPFYSPDGEWIGFFADGELRKVRASGGGVVTLSKVSGNPRGASWGPDGTIVFATTELQSGLLAVSSMGGEPRVLTRAARPEAGEDHTFPFVLPNGRAVVFSQSVYNRISNLAVLDVDSGAVRTLNIAGSHPQYLDGVGLIFWSAGTLRCVGFDPGRLVAIGEARTVAQRVPRPQFHVSQSGSLVVAQGGTGGSEADNRQLVWVDRQGREEDIPAPPMPYGIRHLQISPDGKRVSVDVADEERDIWVWDFERQNLTRVTHGPSEEWYPVWTADGRELIFGSGPPGSHSLARAKADGTGTIAPMTSSVLDQFPQSIAPDGRTLVFRQQAGTTGIGDLHVTSLDSKGSSRPLFETPFFERTAAISPDGNWLAFDSDQTRKFEVYVRPFPHSGTDQVQISGSGGTRPIWSRSGRELFFLAADGNMMVVDVNTGAKFSASVPKKLFNASAYYAGFVVGVYDVSADGRRFVMIKEIPSAKGSAPPPQLIVTTNWVAQIDRR